MRKIPLLGMPLSLLLVAVLIVAALPMVVLAGQITPQQCWGTVTLDGVPAPLDTTIEIFVGEDANPSGSGGMYEVGGYGTVIVNADSDRYGEPLTYKVNGFVATKQGPDDGIFGLQSQIVNLAAVSGPQPPTVTTAAASGVTHNQATLNGNLDIGESTTADVYFEYGTSIAYGSSTSEMTKTASGAFSAAVSGLTPSTMYHFRAVVSYDSTTGNGADMTFTTSEGPDWPKIIPLDANDWNVISTPVWLDEDADQTRDILSGDDWEGLRWSGTKWRSLSKTYTWEPLEAFYVTGTDSATFQPMVSDEPMVPNDEDLSKEKWALIGSSPADGVSSMAINDVLAGLMGNYVNVFVPGSGASCTVGNCDGINLDAFSGAWVFVGGESTRTIVGFYGFEPVIQ